MFSPRGMFSTLGALAILLSGVVRAADTGGQYCNTALCVTGLVDPTTSTVTYQLRSTLGFNTLGWMAIGFGTGMPNSPMVIVWPNQDGTITITQREATEHVMPTPIANPPQVAELAWEDSILATDTTTIAFTLPYPSGPLNSVDMIYAWSSIRPSSNSPSANLQQHDEMGTFQLDLTTTAITSLPTGTLITTVVGTSTIVGPVLPTNTGAAVSGDSVATPTNNFPLTASEKTIRTHGLLMIIGYLVFLPTGIFIARYSRTIPFLAGKWFTAHWFVQFILSGPLIFAGFAIGYKHIKNEGGKHFRDHHTDVGLALLILYLVQLLGGVVIHFFKPAPRANTPPTTKGSITARPIQNYGHAINGLTIIGLALYNVHEAYNVEWTYTFGYTWQQQAFTRHVRAFWISWVVIIPLIYVIGLGLLPRQWRKEAENRQRAAGGAPTTATKEIPQA